METNLQSYAIELALGGRGSGCCCSSHQQARPLCGGYHTGRGVAADVPATSRPDLFVAATKQVGLAPQGADLPPLPLGTAMAGRNHLNNKIPPLSLR